MIEDSESRARVTRIFLKAQAMLPPDVVESDEGYSAARCNSYLEAGKLHPALDELTGVIEDNPSPAEEYWLLLIEAAKQMKLDAEVARCELILGYVRKSDS